MITATVRSWFVLSAIILALPACYNNKIELIEDKLTLRDWAGASAIAGQLPDNNAYEKWQKYITTSSVSMASNLLYRYKPCAPLLKVDPATDESIQCYRDLVDTWNSGPDKNKLPFRAALRARIDAIVAELHAAKPRIDTAIAKKTSDMAIEQLRAKKAEDDEFAIKLAKLAETHRIERERESIAREKESIARPIYTALKQRADNKFAATGTVSACAICFCMLKIDNLETAIKVEWQYADKYGVVNTSGLAQAKQQIQQCDIAIAEQKREYARQTKKPFNKNLCKHYESNVPDSAEKYISCESAVRKYEDQTYQSLLSRESASVRALLSEFNFAHEK